MEKFYISYHKWDKKSFKVLKKSIRENLNVEEIQFYQPYFSLYFDVHNTKHSHSTIDLKKDVIIKEVLSSETHKHYTSNALTECVLYDLKHNVELKKELFCKCIPLIDPLYFIKNNYNNIVHRNPLLPSGYNHNTFQKINDMNNGAYIDTLFSYISSEITVKDILPSFPIFYGSVNGIKDSFRYDISDEYHDLKYEGWFHKNLGITYSIDMFVDSDNEESSLDCDEDYVACLEDMPCQCFFIQKLQGTLEDFLESIESIDTNILLSCLFQIIFALTYLQKHLLFTHNDLHINNIMYESTTKEHIYYKFNNIYFKIPTYGYIFKVIDFGRSIFTFHGKTYFNDTFHEHGEAGGQYTLPFHQLLFDNDNEKQVSPNYNFDLCRLSITILDELGFDTDKDYKEKQPFMNFLYNMTLMNDGTSFFSMSDNFDLYVAISEKATNSTPRDLISNYIFSPFRVKKKNFPKKIFYHL